MEHFRTSLRVRYGETDAMGIVHHGSYLPWFEVGRVELMRHDGLSYRDLEASGVGLPVIEARVRYLLPARFDDELTVEVYGLALTRVRVRLGYTVRRGGDVVAHGYTEHAALGPRGRPVPLPENLRAMFEHRLVPPDAPQALIWSDGRLNGPR